MIIDNFLTIFVCVNICRMKQTG